MYISNFGIHSAMYAIRFEVCFSSRGSLYTGLPGNEVYSFLDERDRVQKKTFTKWINQYLAKVMYHISGLLHRIFIFNL